MAFDPPNATSALADRRSKPPVRTLRGSAPSVAGLATIVGKTRHKTQSVGGWVLLVDPRNSPLECLKCGTLNRKEIYELHSRPPTASNSTGTTTRRS